VRSIPDFSRGFDFEMRSAGGGADGRTLEGYVAMFDARSRIPDRNGDFDEILRAGFADRSLAERTPVMQFDHGKDARVGSVPIGVYDTFERDSKGYHVRGRLFDNPIVEPIRQAIEGRAIKGMSFRFKVAKGGDRWERRHGGVDVREILDADVHEAGPVVFPAYAQTSVSVRSAIATWRDEDLRELLDEFAAITGRIVDPTDLTGQRSTRSARGGDNDAQPWEGDTSASSASNEARTRLMRMRRDPIVLP